MGLLAQKRVLFVLIFLGAGAWAQADEGVFHLTRVDYFGLKLQKQERFDPTEHPPQAVMDLLDHPDEQTARAYLRWQHERLEKIARAQEFLDKVMMSFPGEVSE